MMRTSMLRCGFGERGFCLLRITWAFYAQPPGWSPVVGKGTCFRVALTFRPAKAVYAASHVADYLPT